ncbi:MAG: hypothetical protein EXR72_19675 [Myxococcales bacterium]|nr:hypothetical protein [Myxococcales bacterium]
MSKPNYRVLLSFDGERNLFVARAPELEHCAGEGATRGEALAKVEEEIAAQIQNIHAHGSSPPAAVDEEEFSGDLTLKVSRNLHRDLAWQARSDGIELDHLASELLAAGLEGRRGPGRGRTGGRAHGQGGEHGGRDSIGNERGVGQRPRPGYSGGRNTAILDDRATFIEYVRGLEGGNGPGTNVGGGPARDNSGGGGPGGPGGRGRRRRGGPGPGGRGGMPGAGGNGSGGPKL